MSKKQTKEINEKIDVLFNGFWNIDCLLRIIKEINNNSSWDVREEDVFIIHNLLIQEANKLSEKISELKLNPIC